MLPTLVATEPLDAETLFALDHREACVEISQDWYGNPIGESVQLVVACDPDRMWFGYRSLARCSAGRAGRFVEGLWDEDEVLELFIGASGSEGYLELNLTPDGAWWSRRFASYRAPRDDGRLGGVKIAVETNGAFGRSVLSLPLRELALSEVPLLPGDPAAVAGNVTGFTLRSGIRCALSYHVPPTVAPDFHLPELRQPLRAVPLR